MTRPTTVACVDPTGVLEDFVAALRAASEPFSVLTVEQPSGLDEVDADCVVVPHVPSDDETLTAIDGLDQFERVRGEIDLPIVLYGADALDTDAVSDALDSGAADVIFTPPKRRALIARRIQWAAGNGGSFPDAETLLTELFDVVESDLYIKDDLGRLVAANSNVAWEHGYAPEHITGLTDYELFEEDLADHLWSEEQEMMASRERKTERIDHWIDDRGRDRWHTARKWGRRDGEAVTGLVGDSREVTALIRRERLVSQLHRHMNELLLARSKETVARMVAELPEKVTSLPRTALFFVGGDSVTLEGVDPPPGVALDRFEQWILRSSHLESEQFLVDTDAGLEAVDVPFRGFDFDAIKQPGDDGEIDAAFLPVGERGVLGLFATDQSIEVFTVEIASVIANNVEAVLDRVQREREVRQREQRLSVLSRVLRHNLRNDMNSILAQLQTIKDEVEDQWLDSLASSAIDTGWDLVDVSQQARTIEQRDETVVVTIDDDGPGIPKTEHAVVDGSIGTDLEHSTGLGLWLAYWVVDNSAGEIDIERTDIGSRVVVTLPAIEDDYRRRSGTVE